MRKSVARTVVFMLAVALLSGATSTRMRDPIGCYLVTPPFHGPAAIAAPFDTARVIIALAADGVLRRPQSPREARVHGAWFLRGDTLHAWFSDGFTGWRYQLQASADGWQGVAEYITDEVIVGDTTGPVRRSARWIRRACP